MVVGNFMLLCEFEPDQVYQWFMELFIDAYDWVMVPECLRHEHVCRWRQDDHEALHKRLELSSQMSNFRRESGAKYGMDFTGDSSPSIVTFLAPILE